MKPGKTLATLAIAAWLASGMTTAVRAQTRNYHFDIPTQSLSQALRNYAQICGQEIIFTEAVVAGLPPVALQGDYPADVALQRLLQGTGLTAEPSASGALMIRGAPAQQSSGKQTPPVGSLSAPAISSRSQSDAPSRRSPRNRQVTGEFADARSNTPASPAEESGRRLAEVIVTSQKRAEKLQDVPVSVQVVGSSILAQQNYNRLEDVMQTLPGVIVNDNNSGTSSTLRIRGIGSGYNPSLDQSVAEFYDDIYHGRSRSSGATFLDLDRIEVLKGPQSTFFGNNAIAGALNIVSKKPGDTFEAWGRLLYGQFGQYAVEGAVGGPVMDTFGLRLAVTRSGKSGWIENVTLGESVPRVNDKVGRLTLAFTPGPDLEATLKIEGSQRGSVGSPFSNPVQAASCPALAPFTASDVFFCPELLALRASGVEVPSGLDNNLTSGIVGQGNWLSTFESALTVNSEQWGHTFTATTGFYNYHYNVRFAVPLPESLFNSQVPERYHQLSQELRVASPTGGTLEYLAGAYFQTDQLFYAADVNLGFLGPRLPGRNLGTHNDVRQNEHSESVFGSATWNATDRLKFSAGIRGSWNDKDYVANAFTGTTDQAFGGIVPLPALFGAPTVLSGAGTWHDWMPSAKIQYQFTGRARAYFSFSQGWKEGGFNGLNPTLNPSDVPYGPEHVNAYELGLKSEWFGDTVLLNLAMFRSNYGGLQSRVEVINTECPGGCNLIRNAASAITQGVEAAAQWVVGPDIQLSTQVSYINAAYGSYRNGTPTPLHRLLTGEEFEDLSGSRIPGTPRWSGSINATYNTRLPGNYTLITQVLPYFSSSYYQDYLTRYRGAYTRLDARLALQTADGRWGLDLIGKNLTNRIILIGPPVINQVQASKEQPRNVAIQVRYEF